MLPEDKIEFDLESGKPSPPDKLPLLAPADDQSNSTKSGEDIDAENELAI